ncbi:hypothetical protein BGZ61DRAFT_571138 [Ilyonectria robusta]|uniref:uncharacterized protein n=1 Tax=Ilyonectria robusta TaxID=1079257 RepID=UPI001E8E9CE7|nr:uncharacterized protein BGZ61DRAFT_571138 [Ilyonectria robusta]KAH8654885.1 hypothetical protein BGZ61DRAFT_571138 [Ilyonectria robusta]
MAPIDYSKWENIDTDSEPEASQQQAPMVKASRSLDPVVPGARQGLSKPSVRCEVEKRKFPPWSTIRITEDHPVFSRPVPDVPRLIEVPVVLYRVGTQSSNQADLDNQIATYLNIDADSGFALPEWQSHVGTIVVARKDRKSLLPQHLEGVWMYCDRILDLFGEGEGAPRMLYSQKAFEDWWTGEEDADDWRQ